MSSVYTPNPTAITPITIPSDGDVPIQASDVNPAFEALADAAAFLMPRMDEFLVDGTWTCPATVTRVRGVGYGSGSPGGCGADGDTTGANEASGGGGGGSAEEFEFEMTVTPTLVYAIHIGAAVAGTATGTLNRAADGDDTTVSSPTPTVIGRWRGAQGAGCGVAGVASGTFGALAVGGGRCRIDVIDPTLGSIINANAVQTIQRYTPGNGGDGCTKNRCIDDGGILKGYAGGSCYSFPGGTPGVAGATASSHHGGGPGGGGAAGPGGPGGDGGNGGDGDATTATASTAGADAGANTGAGGGGGGGGGNAGTTPSAGAAGGASGSGRLRLYYYGAQAVIT